jgi:molecular chaperone GrpE
MTKAKHPEEEPKDPKDSKPTPPAEGEAAPGTPAPAQPEGASTGASPEGTPAESAQQEPLVGLTLAEYTDLAKKAERADAAEQKAREYLEGLQRERADFTNYRKRIERENAMLQQTLAANVIKKYLVIADDLTRALKARPTTGDGAVWAEGVELISRKLGMILDAEGIKPIGADGDMFDPTMHEAISSEDSPNHQSGQIIEVLQQGFMIGERVLRPALVRVAR